MAVKEQDNFFTFKERLELLPKGCSPIMSAFSKVDKILSPNSKEYLEKTILKSFQEELQTVKWHNYCDRSGNYSTRHLRFSKKNYFRLGVVFG